LKRKIKEKYDPLVMQLSLTRSFGFFFFFSYWVITSDRALGMILLLGILIFSILRQYFPESSRIIFAMGLFVGILCFVLPELAVAYSAAIFEANLEKKNLLIIPGLILGIFIWEINFMLIAILLLGGFLGVILRTAKEQRDYYKEESDIERRSRHEAEGLNKEILSLQEEVFQMTELSERNRIAQQLHDEVGHELTGAVLGLQVFEAMLEVHDLEPYEKEIFEKVKERVNNSATVLRQTVHNMKPYAPLGVDDLLRIVEDFPDLSINLKTFGNTEDVPVRYWALLKTTLKEGLTNIMRHSKAEKVKVQLDVAPSLLRFSLENDGVIRDKNKADFYDNEADSFTEGMGLRSLRQRTKAYGGNLTATIMKGEDIFRLIIVLPLLREDHYE
jgi:two-component system, NarL family, sensor histidine kinase DesK